MGVVGSCLVDCTREAGELPFCCWSLGEEVEVLCLVIDDDSLSLGLMDFGEVWLVVGETAAAFEGNCSMSSTEKPNFGVRC